MLRSATGFGWLGGLALASVSLVARGEPAGRLVYERLSGAESCPEEQAIHLERVE